MDREDNTRMVERKHGRIYPDPVFDPRDGPLINVDIASMHRGSEKPTTYLLLLAELAGQLPNRKELDEGSQEEALALYRKYGERYAQTFDPTFRANSEESHTKAANAFLDFIASVTEVSGDELHDSVFGLRWAERLSHANAQPRMRPILIVKLPSRERSHK